MEKGTSTKPGDKPDETNAASKEPAPDAAATNAANTSGKPSANQASAAPATDDDESDWEELDEVLDDFSKPNPSTEKAAASGPGRPDASAPPADEFDEEAFLKQLEADMMATLMGGGNANGGNAGDAGQASAADAAVQEAIDKEIDELSKQLKESGIQPHDFLKHFLAETILPSGTDGDGSKSGGGAQAGAGAGTSTSKSGSASRSDDAFQDAIRRTMERMKESGDRATAAATEGHGDVPEDLLAQLLKAIDAGAAASGDDFDLNKMFMGMMEQLSNKDMLYEPIKELHTKFGPWLAENKGTGKYSAEDMARYETQARVVGEIVAKFEEEGYSDDKPECRAYIWEKMQEMQSAGSPPEDLIANPLMEELREGGELPDCPQQ
ncbi:peroxisomal membrane protein receptor Pex19 [Thermoascus aurantiacus ATCC 26904]